MTRKCQWISKFILASCFIVYDIFLDALFHVLVSSLISGSVPLGQLEIRFDWNKLSVIDSVRLFEMSLTWNTDDYVLLRQTSHSLKTMHLCDSSILGILANIPSVLSCQDRNLVIFSSTS